MHIEKFFIDFSHVPDSVVVPAGKQEIKFDIKSSRQYKRNIFVLTSIFVDQKCCEKFFISAKIRTFETVLVAQKKILPNENLQNEDVELINKETTAINRTVFHSVENINGYRTKRFIPKGTVLSQEMIEPIPLVSRGDQVTLVVKNENFLITSIGKALQNGCKNEWVDVLNINSNKRLTGKVIDFRKVLIQF